ncbi:MAG: AbrB/MazE/SpoVT family DNA-binding domain-containing protein [Stagnimonas sp.]|nr:AbrB/MazE/SpoVT family DNA-binding domain-containing protein [Stagnimonas sp.]
MGVVTAITLSSKGQVVLPKRIRAQRNWQPGTVLELEETAEGLLIKSARIFAATTVQQVFGMARAKGAKRTLADMDAAIVAEARRHK